MIDELTLPTFMSYLLQRMQETESPDSRSLLRENPQQLHWAIYKVREKLAAHFPALADVHFVTTGSFPYSAELNGALHQLQDARLIERLNPDYAHAAPARYDDTGEYLAQQKKVIESDAAVSALLDEVVRELKQSLQEA